MPEWHVEVTDGRSEVCPEDWGLVLMRQRFSVLCVHTGLASTRLDVIRAVHVLRLGSEWGGRGQLLRESYRKGKRVRPMQASDRHDAGEAAFLEMAQKALQPALSSLAPSTMPRV